jgi:serine/threonine protein kinase
VLERIGEGGMGAVYRAQDTKLGRSVAIKVLPEMFANDPERVARLQREAQVLAALNHQNIAAIYGMEDRAIVMEFVEGRTLQGPMPLEEAIVVAKQIAEGLEAAHEKAVIHRDLKPANIKITPEGKVKILDFGLARALAGDTAAGNPATSPTLTIAATTMGVILGTAAYMSPEQARGLQADKRSDIWSFGVVLWEMLTGKQLFEGESISDTLAEVLKKEVDFTAIPAPLGKLLQRCLTRDRRQRLQDIGEARIMLEKPEEPPHIAAQPPKPNSLAWAMAPVLGLFVLLLAVLLFLREPSVPPGAAVFEITLPNGVSSLFFPVISPDGKTVALVCDSSKEPTRLFLRPLDSADPKPVPGTEGASYPFWSSDSRAIAFTSDGKLKRLDLATGTVRAIAETSAIARGAWNSEGIILFKQGYSGPISRVSASGGQVKTVTTLDSKSRETAHYHPVFLPDGRRFLFLAIKGAGGTNTIEMASLDSPDRTTVMENPSGVYLYCAGSWPLRKCHLLFQQASTLFAQQFDESAGKLIGEPAPIVEKVEPALGGYSHRFTASMTGAVGWRMGIGSVNGTIVSLDRTGKEIGQSHPSGGALFLSLSPDGRRLASIRGGLGQVTAILMVTDIDRGISTQLTFGEDSDGHPVWSPDGRRLAVAYSKRGSSARTLMERDPSGAGGRRKLADVPNLIGAMDWAPDGKSILCQISSRPSLLLVSLDGSGRQFPIGPLEGTAHGARFSPDGRYIAYASNESGRREVYVIPVPPATGKWQVSSGGGSLPSWGAGGRALYYLNSEGQLMMSVVSLAPAFQPVAPQSVFRMPSLPAALAGHPYAVTRDGQRFYVARSDASGGTPLMVLLNWPARLERQLAE